MTKRNKNLKTVDKEVKDLIKELKKCDGKGFSKKTRDERREIMSKITGKLVSIGKPAVPYLIDLLNDYDSRSCFYAARALGEIGDKRAVKPLVNALEDHELGEDASEALKKFGTGCIPEVIKKVEYRIAHPVENDRAFILLTNYPLSTIGEIRCDESLKFLTELLDDYMSRVPDGPFDPSKRDWEYRNVDFFHLLDCLVRQQDKRAVPHMERARDFFPENYTDYKVCQIAIGRIKKGRVEGYLPLEALDIAMPAGAIMNALSGGELGWKDTFDEEYGEYFGDDIDGDDHEEEQKPDGVEEILCGICGEKCTDEWVELKRCEEGEEESEDDETVAYLCNTCADIIAERSDAGEDPADIIRDMKKKVFKDRLNLSDKDVDELFDKFDSLYPEELMK